MSHRDLHPTNDATGDEGEASGSVARDESRHKPCPYGPQSMNKRIEARTTHLKPQSLAPMYPPVFPVYPRHAPLPNVHPQSLRMHPKGFRVLSGASPIERNLRTYFRLPPQPPKRHATELARIAKIISDDQLRSGASEGVVLNGFAMLDAAGASDPLDVTSITMCNARLVGVIAEDLGYFTNVTFADFGENELALADLVPLRALDTLHLHCNLIKSIADISDVPGGAFPNLQTLNLGFNRVPSQMLPHLAALPLLARLDLSSNNLGVIPAAFGTLRALRQLALENNKLNDATTIIPILGALPLLEEVNLNYNAFGSVPPPPMTAAAVNSSAVEGEERVEAAEEKEGQTTTAPTTSLWFPKLQVLGLGANNFVYFEDLYNLVTFPSLQRVILWGNPIERRTRDADILAYEMSLRDVKVIFDPPIPPKRSAGQFYNSLRDERVVIPAVNAHGLPRRDRSAPPSTTRPPEVALQEDNEPTAGSFFMTQTTHTEGQRQPRSPAAAAQPSEEPRPHMTPSAEPSSSAVQYPNTRVGRRLTTMPSSASQAMIPSPVLEADSPLPKLQVVDARSRLQALAADVDSTLTATQPRNSSTSVRAAMAELRRMLRQPLPQIGQRSRFSSTHTAQNRAPAAAVFRSGGVEQGSSGDDAG